MTAKIYDIRDGQGAHVNTIVADLAFVDAVYPGRYILVGDVDAPAPLVPEMVSMRQARLAMLDAGILMQVDTAIQQLSEADRIEWEYAADLRRDHPLVAMLAPALSLSDEDVDNLFRAAALK